MRHIHLVLLIVIFWPSLAVADPSLLLGDDDEIVQAIPDGYTVDAGGILRTPAGGKAYPAEGLSAVEVSPSVLDDYRQRKAAQGATAAEWEAMIAAKVRELAIAALVAEGHDPPTKPKALKLKNGQVVESSKAEPAEISP